MQAGREKALEQEGGPWALGLFLYVTYLWLQGLLGPDWSSNFSFNLSYRIQMSLSICPIF